MKKGGGAEKVLAMLKRGHKKRAESHIFLVKLSAFYSKRVYLGGVLK